MRLDELTDVRYVVDERCAVVTIDRPERMNAFRGRTVDELISAFKHAWADPAVACVILTGAGERAFCAGGDVTEAGEGGRHRGDQGGRVPARARAPRSSVVLAAFNISSFRLATPMISGGNLLALAV